MDTKELVALLKEARRIIRSDTLARHLHKDWLERAAAAIKKSTE